MTVGTKQQLGLKNKVGTLFPLRGLSSPKLTSMLLGLEHQPTTCQGLNRMLLIYQRHHVEPCTDALPQKTLLVQKENGK